MSLLLAALTAVTSTPLPTPSPQIIKETLQPVVQQVATTPAPVLELFQLLAVAGAGIVTSFVHQMLERGKLKSNINRLILAFYSTAGALGTAYLTGHLGWTVEDATVALTAFVTVLGSATGRYEVWKFLTSLMSKPAPVSAPALETTP